MKPLASAARLAIAATCCAVSFTTAGSTAVVTAAAGQMPLEPLRQTGQGVSAAYEGWFKNADGTFSLLIGYYNRNLTQALDIPVGPDNRIEPGIPDQGQPTHFLPRRQWGVFAVKVPADFGDKKLTWTLTANGKTASVAMGLHRLYEVAPLKDAAQGNTPPVLRFDPKGAAVQGPPQGIASALFTKQADALTLALWASDDGIVTPERRPPDLPVGITWSKYRGPGTVTFANAKPPMNKASGMASTTARFSQLGEYVLRAYANDASSEVGGGFQCCWTTVHVKVTVEGR
jgi:hypothetical protein